MESGEAPDGPLLVPPGAEVPFDATALSRHLRGYGLSFDPDQPLRQIAGGLANRNYLVVVDGALVVLRRPPDGILPSGAHDMAREHRLLSSLPAVLPFVPRSLHYCADPAVLGAPFQLIEYRSGLVVHGSDISSLRNRPDAPDRLCATLVDTLAVIHAVDTAAVGLGDLGRGDGFVGRAVAGWTRRGLLVTGEVALGGVVGEVSAWLDRQAWGQRVPRLLHCDFKLDNIILDPNTLAPRAVVDWDMGTRGDPLFDLATLLSYWAEPGDPECLRTLGQMPTMAPGFWPRATVAARYAAVTGLALDDLPAMQVLTTLKLGIVFLQLHRQWATGAVTDPRYEGFTRVGEDFVLLARDMARDATE